MYKIHIVMVFLKYLVWEISSRPFHTYILKVVTGEYKMKLVEWKEMTYKKLNTFLSIYLWSKL